MDNAQRRIDILQALEDHNSPTATMTLQSLANVWGVTKPAFVSAKGGISGFPDALPSDSSDGAIEYPATVALQAMLAHVEAALRVETPLPRGAGADVPQSDLSADAIPLMYTEQNFNELAAANTALQSELAGRDAVISEKDARIEELQEQNKRAYELIERCEKAVDAQAQATKNVSKELTDERSMHEHTKLLLSNERLRTERAKGYIDRFLDDEQRLDGPVKMPDRPMPPAPKGPALGDIWDPPAPSRNRQDSDSMWASARLEPARCADHEYAPRRRY